MTHETSGTKNFQIEYRGNSYTCYLIENRGRITYQILYNNNHIYLTKAVRAGGILFWTAVPNDPELSSVVNGLGEQIDRHFR
jgi:predicted DNA binding protein